MYSFVRYLQVFVSLSVFISEEVVMEPSGWETDFSISQEKDPQRNPVALLMFYLRYYQ